MSVKNVRFVWDEEFHRLVKAHAAYRGLGMAAFVEACVRAELKEQGVVPQEQPARPKSVPTEQPRVTPAPKPTPKATDTAERQQTASGFWRGPITKETQAGRKK